MSTITLVARGWRESGMKGARQQKGAEKTEVVNAFFAFALTKKVIFNRQLPS